MTKLKQKVKEYIKSEAINPKKMIDEMCDCDFKKMALTSSFQLWNTMNEFKKMRKTLKGVS